MENTATVSGTEVKNTERAGFMDEVRGFCILCMVVYHSASTLTTPIIFISR